MKYFAMPPLSKKKKNSDDPTRVWKCGKIFPEVSAKAMTYLFVAVCMLHNTVHGFHLIPGAEGQKDGHAALYQV
jgi:hypothetical protein